MGDSNGPSTRSGDMEMKISGAPIDRTTSAQEEGIENIGSKQDKAKECSISIHTVMKTLLAIFFVLLASFVIYNYNTQRANDDQLTTALENMRKNLTDMVNKVHAIDHPLKTDFENMRKNLTSMFSNMRKNDHQSRKAFENVRKNLTSMINNVHASEHESQTALENMRKNLTSMINNVHASEHESQTALENVRKNLTSMINNVYRKIYYEPLLQHADDRQSKTVFENIKKNLTSMINKVNANDHQSTTDIKNARKNLTSMTNRMNANDHDSKTAFENMRINLTSMNNKVNANNHQSNTARENLEKILTSMINKVNASSHQLKTHLKNARNNLTRMINNLRDNDDQSKTYLENMRKNLTSMMINKVNDNDHQSKTDLENTRDNLTSMIKNLHADDHQSRRALENMRKNLTIMINNVRDNDHQSKTVLENAQMNITSMISDVNTDHHQSKTILNNLKKNLTNMNNRMNDNDHQSKTDLENARKNLTSMIKNLHADDHQSRTALENMRKNLTIMINNVRDNDHQSRKALENVRMNLTSMINIVNADLDQSKTTLENLENNLTSMINNVHANDHESKTALENMRMNLTSMINNVNANDHESKTALENVRKNLTSMINEVDSRNLLRELRVQHLNLSKEVRLLQQNMNGDDDLGSASNPARSCFHLKQAGQNLSEIYNIRPDEALSSIQVFCDMDSAGGGWTLVASIHENNIDGKCTSGDLWSSDHRGVGDSGDGNGNWENNNTFGTPEAASSADYKSQAYSTLPASDLMIWHVPNDVSISCANEVAHSKYYTNTSFLENFGGNLQTLFKEHYPLRKIENGTSNITELMSALVEASPSMVARVSSFYNYLYDRYDSTNDYIADGGGDMYDSGNKVDYQIGSNSEIRITYDKYYRNVEQGLSFLSSSRQHPFHSLMWIDNKDRREQSYAIKVIGNAGADGNGYYAKKTGTLTHGQFTLRYHAANIYGTSDPSICKVFYYITNAEQWRSVVVVSSVSASPWTTETNDLQHGLKFYGAPRSFLVGYTLLSRANGADVSNSQIRSVLERILSVIASKIAERCDREQESLIQPVVYLTGSAMEMSEGIPPAVRHDTSAGYIQFRAYNWDGIPNAICPGVKTTSCYPESVCIGGIDTTSTNARACGDFAGWKGHIGDSPSKTQPSGWAKSLDDIESSIMIFTRKQE